MALTRSERANLLKVKTGQSVAQLRTRDRPGEDRDALRRRIRPGLIAGKPGDTASDSGAAIDIGDAGVGLLQLVLAQREVRTGEDDGVDAGALWGGKQRCGGVANGVERDGLPAEYGLGH